jgi:hypothetical protein
MAKENDPLKKIHNLSIENNARICRVGTDNFLVMLYIAVEDFEKAAETAKRYLLSKMTEAEIDAKPDWAANHICLYDALELMAGGASVDEVVIALEPTYPEKVVNEVREVVSRKHRLSSYFGIPDCFNCSECNYQGDCNFENGIDMLEKVQDLMCQFDFDQQRLSDLFSF